MQGKIIFVYQNNEKLYSSHGRQVMWSTILVKHFHLFKIFESVFSFYLKLHNFKQVGVFYWNGGPHYLFTIRTLDSYPLLYINAFIFYANSKDHIHIPYSMIKIFGYVWYTECGLQQEW